MPDSVIVKAPRHWAPFLPDAAGGPAGAVFNEWAALEWLGELDVSVVPRLLAADRAKGILVMSDVPVQSRLDQLLLGDSPSSAAAGLTALGEALGIFHSATIGEGADGWIERRDRLGPRIDVSMQSWFKEQVDAFLRTCSAMAIDTGGVEVELQQISDIWAKPGLRHALTHGDPCPDNLLLRDGKITIVDFETAGWRLAAHDASYARVPFPTCWCIGAIPGAIVDEMEAAYRSYVRYTDDEWDRDLATACALWFLSTVPYQVTTASEEDRSWGTAGLRGRVTLRSRSLAAVTRKLGRFDRMGHIAEQFARRAIELWGSEADIEPYPAFRRWRAG